MVSAYVEWEEDVKVCFFLVKAVGERSTRFW
jgi:hypothetical protein